MPVRARARGLTPAALCGYVQQVDCRAGFRDRGPLLDQRSVASLHLPRSVERRGFQLLFRGRDHTVGSEAELLLEFFERS